jgi:hypothetical protein
MNCDAKYLIFYLNKSPFSANDFYFISKAPAKGKTELKASRIVRQ